MVGLWTSRGQVPWSDDSPTPTGTLARGTDSQSLPSRPWVCGCLRPVSCRDPWVTGVSGRSTPPPLPGLQTRSRRGGLNAIGPVLNESYRLLICLQSFRLRRLVGFRRHTPTRSLAGPWCKGWARGVGKGTGVVGEEDRGWCSDSTSLRVGQGVLPEEPFRGSLGTPERFLGNSPLSDPSRPHEGDSGTDSFPTKRLKPF